MKPSLHISFSLLLLFITTRVSAQNWVTVRNYDFDNMNLNELKEEWRVRDEASCEYPENLEINNSKVIINVEKEANGYSTATINSRRFYQYGKFKFRFKIGEKPTVNVGDFGYDLLPGGFNFAAWLISKDATNGTHPYVAEIDVFESCGGENDATFRENEYQNATGCFDGCSSIQEQFADRNEIHNCSPESGLSGNYFDCNINYGWNTMTLIWKENSLEYKTNGETVWALYTTPTLAANDLSIAWDTPLRIVLSANHSSCGERCGSTGGANDNLPEDFEIDYVKVKKRESKLSCEDTVVNVCNYKTPVRGEKIIMPAPNEFMSCSGNRKDEVVVYKDGNMDAKASDRIELKPGFHAENGSKAHFRIGNCSEYNFKNNDISDNKEKSSNLKKKENDSKIDIYPNPVDEILNIEFNNESMTESNRKTIKLRPINSRNVLRKTEITSIKTSINVSDLRAGMYIIQVIDDNIYNKKIIVR